jgi:hypothetical protein
MLYALIEGLAGIEDQGCLLRSVRLAPRWVAAGCPEVEASVSYAVSGASLGYRYVHRPGQKTVAVEVQGDTRVSLHLQLPAGTRATALRVNGRPAKVRTSRIEQSSYADAEILVRKGANIIVEYRGA